MFAISLPAAGQQIFVKCFDIIKDAPNTGFETDKLYQGTLFPNVDVKASYTNINNNLVFDTVRVQAVGEVFDPKSGGYDTWLSRYNGYGVDSVSIACNYHLVPQPGAAPDTLIFQFYNSDSILTKVIPATKGVPKEQAAYIRAIDHKQPGGAMFNRVKYLLSENDTGGLKFIKVAADPGKGGIKIKPGKLFAYTVSYRPGFAYTPGDTIDETIKPMAKNLHSRFSYFSGRTIDKSENSDYENSLTKYTDNKMGIGQSWDGYFFPGAAYPKFGEVLYSRFYIHVINPGAIDNTEEMPSCHIYPSPGNGNINFDFTLDHSAETSVDVYDMLGNMVASMANGNYHEGVHHISFNSNNIKPGVFICKIVSGNATQSMRFVVSE